MTAESRARFAEVVRADRVDLGLACALIGVEADPDLDPAAVCAELDDLAARVIGDVPTEAGAGAAAAALRRALGEREGFGGTVDDYRDVRGSLLHEVLRRRHGLPILLSIVYVEIGRRVGVAVEGIGVPGHFLVAVTDGLDRELVDPYDGGRRTTLADVAARVEALHPGAELHDDDLAPWHPIDVLRRVLANIRGMSSGIDAVPTQLWATELSLLLPHHPASLRRDRGRLLARLGDYGAAAEELEEYAAAIAGADPEAAEDSLRQARLVRSRLS